MKVFIITEGGKDIGLGHVARCCSLYDAFAQRGVAPTFVLNGNTAKGLLKNRRKKVFDWLRDDRKLFAMVRGADIAVIDSYLAPLSFYKKISGLVNIPAYLDDNKRIDYPKGFIVNGTLHAEKIGYPKKEGITYLLGSRYIPIRKEFWDVGEKEISDKLKSIMVTFGGNDAIGITPKILKLLRKNYPGLIKNVIIGKSFQNIDQIKKEADNNTILIYYPGSEKMKKVMLESDIAISAGGQTLYELARVGLPVSGVRISENQELNLRGFHESGFLKFVGRHDDDDLDRKIIETIEGFSRKEERKSSSSVGRRLIDGQGAKRVIDRILHSA